MIATDGGMGGGDVILAAALGAHLGISGLVVGLWLGFVLGGAFATLCVAFGLRGRKEPIPYGPCLGIWGEIALFATPAFGAWVERTFLIARTLQ